MYYEYKDTVGNAMIRPYNDSQVSCRKQRPSIKSVPVLFNARTLTLLTGWPYHTGLSIS